MNYTLKIDAALRALREVLSKHKICIICEDMHEEIRIEGCEGNIAFEGVIGVQGLDDVIKAHLPKEPPANSCRECSYWSSIVGCALGEDEQACQNFLARKDIPYHQTNIPIQIQHTIVDPPAGYHQAVELLTVLYQDGTIMQGRCTAGYGEHTWLEIALPPRKPAGESE